LLILAGICVTVGLKTNDVLRVVYVLFPTRVIFDDPLLPNNNIGSSKVFNEPRVFIHVKLLVGVLKYKEY
jgi:hypothetical protein